MMSTKKINALEENIGRVVKGKREVVRLAVMTLLARGHLLIEDVPGVGKTTLAHSLARSLSLSFCRIQFTSDLLPSDILGVTIFNEKTQVFEFKAGPIFANIILADEINRTTPKTQSSLLEAMNEAQISIDTETHRLPQPFMVIATQNPAEHHGTYPLPESQLDRFMLRIGIGYPDADDEKQILLRRSGAHPAEALEPVLTGDEVLALQADVDTVTVDDTLVDYLLAIVQATRQSDLFALGVSPRGALALQRAAQAYAFMEGRRYCLPDDIKRLAPLVFSHRVVITKLPDTHGPRRLAAERMIRDLVDAVPVPI